MQRRKVHSHPLDQHSQTTLHIHAAYPHKKFKPCEYLFQFSNRTTQPIKPYLKAPSPPYLTTSPLSMAPPEASIFFVEGYL